MNALVGNFNLEIVCSTTLNSETHNNNSIVIYPCPEPRHRTGALPERALPRRQQDAGDQLGGALGREEGVDQGGARVPAQAHV